MLKPTWIILFVLLIFNTMPTAYCQQRSIPQSVYMEGLGSGIFYSFNFDTRFSPQAHGWGGRAGMGYTSVDGARLYTVPLGINYLLGKQRNFFELGAGVTFIALNDKTNNNVSSNLVAVQSGAVATVSIGYRRVSASGFTFRAGLSPLIGNVVEAHFWPQMSLGYSF